MSIRVARIVIVMAFVTCLGACSSSTKLGDLLKPNSSASSDTQDGTSESSVVTGSFVTQPAEPGPSGESFRATVEKHPNDAEAWVGLAASYDRLHRFDLADRAYTQAIRIIGPTVEILNDQGFSYMLRGDYTRAHKKLQEAQAKDPSNPYVQANLQLLEESYREGKSIQ
jgi:Tfp pilus assembly protein PilF